MAAFPLQCIDQPLLSCFGTFDASVIYCESSSKAGFSNNESILSNKCGEDSSTSMVESYSRVEFGEQVTQRKVKKMDQKKSNGVGSSLINISSSQSMVGNEVKRKRQKKTISVRNQDKEMKVKKTLDKKEEKKISEAPIEYVHVRARRGQATDSHSLAERARREKIREKMKILQGLVPGCDKVTGKALMLDEIINYVQSLQNQVEFLSMKSSSLSPFFEFGMLSDSFIMTHEADQRVNAEPPNNISDTFTGLLTAPTDNYPLLDQYATSSLSFDPQINMPYTLTQDDGQGLWDVISDHQGQKFNNEFGFMTNNLCSFH